MKFDLLAIGDNSIDEFMLIDDAEVTCDKDDENCKLSFDYAGKIQVKEFKTSVAGNAPNVVIGCSTLGLKPAIYTEVGDDANADIVINTLKERGVDTTYIHKNTGTPTNVHPIAVYQGERTIFAYHEKRSYKIQDWESPKFLYYTSLSEGFENFHDKLLEFVKKDENIIFVINPGTLQMKVGIEKLRNALKRTDILFANKEEAANLANIEGPTKEVHKKLWDMGVKLSVITDSVNGSSTFDGEEIEVLGICNLNKKTLDKTGAGDSYASGFLSAIFYRKTAKEAMKWGSVNAANVIAKIGAIEGLTSKEEMERLVATAKFDQDNID